MGMNNWNFLVFSGCLQRTLKLMQDRYMGTEIRHKGMNF
jgi:hypothetical protein